MPKVNIDGIGVVNFPDDYTPDRIKFAIENDILPRVKQPKQPDAFDQALMTPEKPSAGVRFSRGVNDLTEGVTQLGLMAKDAITGSNEAKPYTADRTRELEAYERGRGPDAGMDWMRLGGNALTMAAPVGGGATLGARVGINALQGAITSGALFTPEGESKIAQTVAGGVGGAAIPLLGAGVRKIAGKALPAVAANIPGLQGDLQIKLQQKGLDWNKLSSKVQESLTKDAQAALSAGGTLDDVMLANKAMIERVGAVPTKASVSRLPRDWQAEKNLRGIAGAGDEIVKREQTNAAAMVDYLGKLRAGSGGKASTAYEAGESAVKAIKAQDAAKEKVVTELYDAFRSAGGADVPVPDVRIADAMGRVADEIGVENIPASVLNRLKEFGYAGGSKTKLLTVNEADKLNRLINNNNPGFGPQSLALGRIKQSLNEALLEAPAEGGSQALMKARAAAAQRFAEQDASKGIAAAIDDIAPDRFVKRFILDADVRELRGTLKELGKSPAGQQAVKDIKGNVLDSLLLKATGASSTDDVLGKPFSGVKFGKALDSIPPEKLHQLFSPSELESLRALQKASKLLTEEVPFSDVNHSKTAAAMANLLQKIGNTPMLGQLVSPILGTAKIGMDWVQDATARKAVADALVGSAGVAGKSVLPAANIVERAAPYIAGPITYQANQAQ